MGVSRAYRPPLSGKVIGAVITALQIRDEVLSSRTAARYFRGQSISKYSKKQIFETVARRIVDSGIVPSLSNSNELQRPLHTLLAQVLVWHATKWDELGAFMQSHSARVTRVDVAAVSYLRLAVIDLAIRAVALLRLLNIRIPEGAVPLWAEESGGGRYLRGLLSRAKLTRDKLTQELDDISHNTVDNWLDSKSRPSDTNIDRIANVLASYTKGGSADVFYTQIRGYYALCAVCDLLARYIGREAVVSLAAALVRFMILVSGEVDKHIQPQAKREERVEFTILLQGTQSSLSRKTLKDLWRIETDHEWKKDLLAACTNWSIRLQQVAAEISGGGIGRPAGLAQGLPESMPQEEISFKIGNMMAESVSSLAAGNFDKAVGVFDSVIAELRHTVNVNPESAESHFALGSMLGKIGERFGDNDMVEEGLLECRIAAQIEPAWDTPRVEVGIILINTKHYGEALKELESAAQLFDELSPHFAFSLGFARMQCNDPAGALGMFERVIEVEPEYALALDNAAHCSLLIGDQVKGRDLAKRAHHLGVSETYEAWQAGKYKSLAEANE